MTANILLRPELKFGKNLGNEHFEPKGYEFLKERKAKQMFSSLNKLNYINLKL